MKELTKATTQLPDTLEDLSKFVLVGREKLTSVRAEIRAINKLELAEEVRNQKKEEALMLSEALLDAEVRLGDLLSQIPKQPAGRPEKIRDTADPYLLNTQWSKISGDQVPQQKPKSQIIEELGFEKKQAQRFETLAKNKDLVEQVKAEARENDDIPTRSRVLDLAKARKQKQEDEERSLSEYSAYLDKCKKLIGRLRDMTYGLSYIPLGYEELKMVGELLGDTGDEEQMWIEIVEEDIGKLQVLLKFLKGRYK